MFYIILKNDWYHWCQVQLTITASEGLGVLCDYGFMLVIRKLKYKVKIQLENILKSQGSNGCHLKSCSFTNTLTFPIHCSVSVYCRSEFLC